MSGLVGRLLAAIEETKRDAEWAKEVEKYDPEPGVWRFDLQGKPVPRIAGTKWESATSDGVWNCDDPDDECAEMRARDIAEGEHIARHDPATVIRRCAADERVWQRHEPTIPDGREHPARVTCLYCSSGRLDRDEVLWPCPDVVDLADRYGIEGDG